MFKILSGLLLLVFVAQYNALFRIPAKSKKIIDLAIIIGFGDYSGSPELSNLTGANDAHQFERAFRLIGYKTLKITTDNDRGPLTRSGLLKCIEEAVDQYSADRDVILRNLVLIVGAHGARLGNTDYILLPSFGDEAPQEKVAGVELYDLLGNSGADNIIVFTDACRNPSETKEPNKPEPAPLMYSGMANLPTTNFYHLAATRQNMVSLEFRGMGIFSFFLLEVMRSQYEQLKADLNADSLISILELSMYLEENVTSFVRIADPKKPQQPTIYREGSPETPFLKIQPPLEAGTVLNAVYESAYSSQGFSPLQLDKMKTVSDVGCRLGLTTEYRNAAPPFFVDGVEYIPHLFEEKGKKWLVYYGSFGQLTPQIPKAFHDFVNRTKASHVRLENCDKPKQHCTVNFISGKYYYEIIDSSQSPICESENAIILSFII